MKGYFVEVARCFECRHMGIMKCGLDNKHRVVEDGESIPSWCPLEDKE